jgi:RsiW-degrading membrane proteinase PrsW (M82 family)
MGERRDPVEARDDGTMDLYEISQWEVRSRLDRFSVWLYGTAVAAVRLFVVGLAVLILVGQFALGGLGLVTDPVVGAFVVLSAVPAGLLAAYLWYADVTTSEPLELLVATFLLGVLFASFAGILNTELGPYVAGIGSGFGAVPIFGAFALFFLVVGPVEEAVKLLAVRLHAYRSPSFDAVIDGAVYGAVAGLGFATIENALYITRSIEGAAQMVGVVTAGSDIAAVRALAGPGHVIYSAFAGYYLGLAKFNRDHAGPLVVKGIIVAAAVHGTYNVSATVLVPSVTELFAVGEFVAFLGFVVLYDGLFGYLLLRKLAKYNAAYREVNHPNGGEAIQPDRTEFE